VLLDEFEPGTTTAELADMFSRLRDGLAELTSAVREAEPLPEITGSFDAAEQRQVADHLIAALGFDTHRGRLDTSEHPFTVTVGGGDVRITTRIETDNLMMMLGATVHETGHALYEQGLPIERLGTMTEGAASMGLHESQSRFWENTIGRSLPFYRWLQGPLRDVLGDRAPDADQLFRASCRVQPGLNRVTADEVTYNLHIIVRFELELALIEGTLAVEDLPEAWNAAYADTLHVQPPDDRSGCLQDVHWAHGSFGYFPSYTLGNLYAASLTRTLVDERPMLWDDVADGRFAPILHWLRTHVHSRGRTLDAPDIVRAVCGERDPVDDLLHHLWGRHGALYGLSRPA
jgi:carboxypeptidase Taq